MVKGHTLHRIVCGGMFLSLFSVCSATDLFEMPAIQPRHMQLRRALLQALRAGQTDEMARIAREGVALLPDDPTWQYNLACALAYREEKQEALEALSRAIDLGFRDVSVIAEDKDLASLRGMQAFKELLAKARTLQGQPVMTRPRMTPAPVVMGLAAEVGAGNTLWDLDAGAFRSHFALIAPGVQRIATHASAYRGVAAETLAPLFRTNAVSGNFGDLYVNRDHGHARLATSNYPGLTPVFYSEAAQQQRCHMGLPNSFFNAPVVGNASLSMVKGPLWRSLPRAAMTDPLYAVTAFRFYFDNQIWVFPEHQDHDPEGGDLFPAHAPFFVISQGSSGSDLPFVSAFAAAMAAFKPETKRALLQRKAMAPTLRALLAATQKAGSAPGAYLTGEAHPVVFDADRLDPAAMVRLAHALTPETIPPLVLLRRVKEEEARPGIDYFDLRPEKLFDTPCCLARVARHVARARTMTVSAAVMPRQSAVSFTWVVLQGQADKVTITPLRPDGSQVEIRVAYHGVFRQDKPDGTPDPIRRSRVDIGCFVQGEPLASAPAIVSFHYLPNETRVYGEDGRILSVDYANTARRYADPLLTMQKAWKDLYTYDEQGRGTGWYRTRRDGAPERYTHLGHKVIATDAHDRPLRACAVAYLPRQRSGPSAPPALICVEQPKQFVYTYEDDADRRGRAAAAP